MHYITDVLLFVLVLSGFGVLAGSFWDARRTSIENLLVPPMLFFGGYALLVWLTGLVRLVPGFFLIAPWPVLLALAVWHRRNFPLAIAHLRQSLKSLSQEQTLLLGFIALMSGLTFVLSLAPPSGADYDSLVYHLAAPAQYLRQGRIIDLPTDHHSYFPFTLEIWFLLGLAAKGPVLAKLFHWLMLPVGAFGLAALGSRAGRREIGLWAAALYVSMPLIALEATTAYIDLGFTAFSVLAVLALVRALEGDVPVRWLLISGAFCGYSLGSKYFGALIFGFLGLWLLGSQIVNRKVQVRHLVTFALPAILLGGPWYIRNLLWTGNPVFPFAYEVFGGAHWTLAMAKQYAADQAKFGFGHSALDLLWAAWRLAMTPLNLGTPYWPLRSDIGVTNGTNGAFEVQGLMLTSFVGPAWLAVGIPALFLRSKPKAVVLTLSFFCFLWIFWLVTSQQIRYLIPALALLGVVGGWGISRLREELPIAYRAASVTLGLWFVVALFVVARQGQYAWPVISGQLEPERYLQGAAPGYLAMKVASTQTPPSAVFAVYGEPRCYYLDRRYFFADSGHSTVIPYDRIQTGTQLVAALKKEGATHVLWNEKGPFGPPPQWQQSIDEGLATELFADRGYRVFVLN